MELTSHLMFSIRFWELAIASATATSQRHMIEAIVENFDSVVQQGLDLPDEVLHHLALTELLTYVTDIVLLDNVRCCILLYIRSC